MLSALMLATTIMVTPSSGSRPDPLLSAIAHFRTIESYRATIHSKHPDGEEHIRYYYRKPGFVRMEFINPHDGAVLIYNPLTQSTRLWPFGVDRFPELSLSPENSLIRSLSGLRVDQSDVGMLFENIRTLKEGGSFEILREENMGGHATLHFIVTGASGISVAGVHLSEMWLDMASQFPVKVISRDLRDALIESVMMESVEINVSLPDTLFNP